MERLRRRGETEPYQTGLILVMMDKRKLSLIRNEECRLCEKWGQVAAKVYMPLFSCYNNRYAEFMNCVTDGDEVHG